MDFIADAKRSSLGGIKFMGLGDEIIASGQVKQVWEETSGECQIVLGPKTTYEDRYAGQERRHNRDRPIIFRNNPKLTTDIDWSKDVRFVENYVGRRPYIKNKGPLHDRQRYNFNWDFKVIPGEIFFDENEKRLIDKYKKAYGDHILLNPVTKNGLCVRNKDWGGNKWVALAEELHSKGYKTVQTLYDGNGREALNDFGKIVNPTLPHTVGVPSNSFRDMMCLIAACAFSVTTEGAVHHAAAALDKKAVVIFGGRVPPSILGYDSHVNLYIEEVVLSNGEKAQSPCGNHPECEHCSICMDKILVSDVLIEVERFSNNFS